MNITLTPTISQTRLPGKSPQSSARAPESLVLVFALLRPWEWYAFGVFWCIASYSNIGWVCRVGALWHPREHILMSHELLHADMQQCRPRGMRGRVSHPYCIANHTPNPTLNCRLASIGLGLGLGCSHGVKGFTSGEFAAKSSCFSLPEQGF